MTDEIRTTLDMQSTDYSFSTESERWVQSFELKHDLMVNLSCKPKNLSLRGFGGWGLGRA